MAQLLDVKIMDFKCSMRHLTLFTWFHGPEKEGMMVCILQTTANVEEADSERLAAVDHIRWG